MQGCSRTQEDTIRGDKKYLKSLKQRECQRLEKELAVGVEELPPNNPDDDNNNAGIELLLCTGAVVSHLDVFSDLILPEVPRSCCCHYPRVID